MNLNPWITDALLVALAYVLGCINAAYYGGRLFARQDIREFGSGNAGARNAGRLFGTKGFIAVFLVDALKAIVAVWLANRFASNGLLPGICALVVVIGHIWPIQMRWQGGKGVSPAIGSLLTLAVLADWHSLLAVFLILLPLLLFTHRSNLRRFFSRQASQGDST